MLFWIFRKLVKLVRHSLFLSLLFIVSICLTLIIYSIFYNWYLPKARLQRDVLFEMDDAVYKVANGREFIHSELVGVVNLFNDPSETLHYGQEYSVSLKMDLPESDSNFEIGMFGITLDVVDLSGHKTASFKTMGTLQYKSTLLRYLTTICYFPLYLIGRFDQRQYLSVVLKDNFMDNSYVRANKFVIRIHEKLQLYNVQLIIEAKFHGLKYYLHNWYYTTSLVVCAFLLSSIYMLMLTTFFDIRSLFMGSSSNSSSSSSSSESGSKSKLARKKSSKDLILLKSDLAFDENDNYFGYEETSDTASIAESCASDESNLCLAPRNWFAEYERNVLGKSNLVKRK